METFLRGDKIQKGSIGYDALSDDAKVLIGTNGDSPFEKGDAENSAVLKGEYNEYSNKAISQTSMAVGAATTAGLKGWYYSDIDFTNKRITLSDKPTYMNIIGVLINGEWSSGTPNIKVNDVISLVNDRKYDLCSKVTAVNGKVITVDILPFDGLVQDSGAAAAVRAGQFSDGYSIYIPERPDAGLIDFGGGAFSEGGQSMATNICAHAEGRQTHAYGQYSHAEGRETEAGYAAHAEGKETTASGNRSHAEGYKTQALGSDSHAEGSTNVASGTSSHAEGYANTSLGNNAHTEGRGNTAKGAASHAEGVNNTVTGNDAHAEGSSSNKANIADGDGIDTIQQKWTESKFSLAHGNSSHVEGIDTLALGTASHAEGYRTIASGYASHAEGSGTTASNKRSHAEGTDTTASGESSHAEGYSTTASGYASHAEGAFVNASGIYSHAEGTDTTAAGSRSHAEGYGTQTNNIAEHASGKFNKSTSSSDGSKATHFSIGIGTSNTDRKNAVEVKQNGDIYVEGVEGKIQDKLNVVGQASIISVTYNEIVGLRSDSKLIPGQQYRITDYMTTTVQENTRSAEHQFDIIVTADDVNVLNEKARAIHHEFEDVESDEAKYFANSNLAAWELWYSLDNDTERFAWADATNGKGVIYYMKDEFNNECPYDFKNIQFARWQLSNPVGYRNDYDNYEDNWIQESTPFGSLKAGFYGLNGSENVFYYGDDEDWDYYKYKVVYTISESPTYCYTFGMDTDYSINGSNYGNVIKEYKKSNKIQLNNIVFLSNNCYSNTFGNNCYSNSFGEVCDSNSFGNYCSSNSFGSSCDSNSFGEGCDYNSFGNNCHDNSFGNGCYSNSFGNKCSSNSFGNNCYSNSFGNYCSSNSFGNYCYSNSFGNSCSSNSFGDYCYSNSFGESKDKLGSYYRYIIFDNGNRYINLNCTSTTSSSKYFQNVRIGLGVNNTTTKKTISDSNVGQTYQTLYKPTDSKELTA